LNNLKIQEVHLAESVDARALKALTERCGGSSPPVDTNYLTEITGVYEDTQFFNGILAPQEVLKPKQYLKVATL
jgi:hypothetical protein